MSNYFKPSDTLFDITERYPETIPVFASNGFAHMEDEAQREALGKAMTLEMALMLKSQNIDTFSSLLDQQIDGQKNQTDATLATPQAHTENGVNVVGLLPCPVRLPLLERYNDFIQKNPACSTINTELKAASMGTEWVEENLNDIDNADALPDLFMSAGFDLFFDREKIGKFKDAGTFTNLVQYTDENPLFAGRGLTDPDNNYSVISVVPAVFLVNTKELDGRPVPQSWADILKPEWENSVSLPVGDFDLFNAILLNLHAKYGDAGIEKLGRAMLTAMHPSQMVKSNRSKAKKPAVTIMPYFFTKTVKEGGPMVAVWPEDGAILSPIFMLAKKSRAKELQPIVDFFASQEVGEILSHQGLFPSLHPAVDNNLPDDAPMMWLGWDVIREKNLSEEIQHCSAIFEKAAEGVTP